MKHLLFSFTAGLLLATIASAAPLTMTVTAPAAAESEIFHLGTARAPDGSTLTATRESLVLNGRLWTPVMGEFHYTRYPAEEWREELLKMKAGGIDIVATYVFWIHHEEIEGAWDWAGDKDLHRFVQTAGEVGLKVIVRCGPWCHGEVRNGGLPDWIVARGQTRTLDPAFLAGTKELYGQIAARLQGLLWKDGGPVIGIQVDNEYRGPAEYLLTLKKIARNAGLDVPLYTRTGWPALSTPMPFGEIVPLYGVYAEGFWDRELATMPGNYWAGFHFSTLRVDSNIANEALGRGNVQDAPDVIRYPYLTCEIGGGMMSAYHRRILVDPRDIESTTMVKLGSGSVSPGYYMYHGGVNPPGRLTTLMEEQATAITNWNDMPVKNYDFQAPLGQYGQIRPQYHTLRRLHLFLRSFGATFAGMGTFLPDRRPAGKDDLTTLRWAARSDGQHGFVFVNNYERGRDLPAKADVQFTVQLAGGHPLTFPATPVTVPADAHFFWPFNLDLGHDVTLTYATAQPVCAIDDDEVRTVFFAAIPGVPAEFSFNGGPGYVSQPGHGYAHSIYRADGSVVRIVLLTAEDSLALWAGEWAGRERVFLTPAGLVVDGDELRLTSLDPAQLTLGLYPTLHGEPDGVFMRQDLTVPPVAALSATAALIHPAGPLRTITKGKSQQPVAAAPGPDDFAAAAVWRITLPAGLDFSTNPILRLHYTGDVARVLINGRFITDDYYNGLPLDIGLWRHAADLVDGELTVAILPLQQDAPIYLPDSAKPDFGGKAAVATLDRVELLPHSTVELTAEP